MAETRQDLKVVMSFQGDAAQRGIDATGKSLKNLGDTSERASKQIDLGLNRLLKAGLSLVSIRAAIDTVRDAYRAMLGPMEAAYTRLNQLGAFSERLGVAPERVRSLQFAFEELDVSTEDLNQSLRLLQRNIGLALLDPKGEVNQAFAQIKVSVKDMEGGVKSVDQVLLEIANRFQAIDSEAEKSAISMQLLGRGGDQLVAALTKGGGAIAAIADKARMMLPDYAGSQTFAEVKKIQDKLLELRLSWQSSMERLLVSLAPSIEKFLDFLQRVADNLPAIIEQLKGALSDFVGWAKNLPLIGTLFEKIFDRANNIAGIVSAPAAIAAGDSAHANAFKTLSGSGAFMSVNTPYGPKFPETGGDFFLLAQKKQDVQISDDWIKAQLKNIEAMRKYTEAVEAYQKALTESTDAGVGFRKGIQDYVDQLGAAGDQMRRVALSIAQGMEQAFTSFFFEIVMRQIRTLRDALASLAKMLAQVFAGAGSMLLSQLLMAGITGAAGFFAAGPAPPAAPGLIIPEAPGFIAPPSLASTNSGGGGQRRDVVVNLVFPGVDAHSAAQFLVKHKDSIKGIFMEAMHTDASFRSGMVGA